MAWYENELHQVFVFYRDLSQNVLLGAAAGSGSGSELGPTLVGKSHLETHNVQIKREAHAGCFSGKLKIVVACSQKIGEHPSVMFSCWEALKSML